MRDRIGARGGLRLAACGEGEKEEEHAGLHQGDVGDAEESVTAGGSTGKKKLDRRVEQNNGRGSGIVAR
jgi:hypothetical protein